MKFKHSGSILFLRNGRFCITNVRRFALILNRIIRTKILIKRFRELAESSSIDITHDLLFEVQAALGDAKDMWERQLGQCVKVLSDNWNNHGDVLVPFSKPAMIWVVYESTHRKYLHKVQHACAKLDHVNTLLGDSTDANIALSQEIVSQIIAQLTDYVYSSSQSMIIRKRRV